MSKNPVTIIHNPVIAQVMKPERDVRLLIADMLSYEIANAQYATAGSSWDGSSSMYDMRKDRFPAGFVRLVRKKLERLGYSVIVRTKPIPEPLGPLTPVVDDFGYEERYSYQLETAARLIGLKRMVAQCATGSGKSRIFKICAARIGRPTLFLTTRKTLMYQMADNYEASMKKSVGILGDGEWRPHPTGVNFGLVGTLASRLRKVTVEDETEKAVERHLEETEKRVESEYERLGLPTNTKTVRVIPEPLRKKMQAVRQKVEQQFPLDSKALARKIQTKVSTHDAKRQAALKLLAGIEFLCLEEAHEVSGDGFYRVSNACTNAWYRLALTGTPFMKEDNQEGNMQLMAASGTIGIKVSEKDLIDRGILATPYFKRIATKRPERLSRSSPWQKAQTIGITENIARNLKIVDECLRARSYGLTSMILVSQVKHGRLLGNLLKQRGINFSFIKGEDDQKSRKRELDKLGTGEIDVLIGTSILDVGVDVPSVGLIVLAGGGKAEVALRQRIGRGLRAKKAGPNVAFVVDFTDNWNNHTLKHAKARFEAVDNTPGFAENVVDDFDYAGLGLKKAS